MPAQKDSRAVPSRSDAIVYIQVLWSDECVGITKYVRSGTWDSEAYWYSNRQGRRVHGHHKGEDHEGRKGKLEPGIRAERLIIVIRLNDDFLHHDAVQGLIR